MKWGNVTSIFQGRIRTGVIINLKHKDLDQFFSEAFCLFKRRIQKILKTLKLIKLYACLCAEFVGKPGDQQEIYENKYFNSKSENIDQYTDLNEWFKILLLRKLR